MAENNDDKPAVTVEVINNGPLKITGNIFLRDLKKDINKTSTEVSLCRCGRSRNKPYCDNSHSK